MSSSPRAGIVRNALIAFLVVGGGMLQYAYSSTNHPSTLLKVWALIFGVLGVGTLLSLAFLAIQRFKDARAGQ